MHLQAHRLPSGKQGTWGHLNHVPRVHSLAVLFRNQKRCDVNTEARGEVDCCELGYGRQDKNRFMKCYWRD